MVKTLIGGPPAATSRGRLIGPRIEFLSPEQLDDAPDVVLAWSALIRDCRNLRAIFQSPVWWECIRERNGARLSLAVVRDSAGSVVGVSPLRLIDYPLTFEVLGHRLCNICIPAIEILGGVPLLPKSLALHLQFFRSVLDHFPGRDVISMPNVLAESYCWGVLQDSHEMRSRTLVYLPEGVSCFHSISLAPTFPEYLSKFKTDTRKKLERKARRLRDRGGGRLELVRIESVSEVDLFLEKAMAISKHTWQERVLGLGLDGNLAHEAFLKSCARSGVLRSYLLKCGDEFCSFGLGYQFQTSYHYVQIGYDERLSRFSPGTVQFFLMLEDLTRYRPVRRLDFGPGDWTFKRRFSTDLVDQASMLVMTRRLANALRVSTHSSFYGVVRPLKRMLGRRDFVRSGGPLALPDESEAEPPHTGC